MSKTKRLTVSAACVAIGVLLNLIGSFVEIADLSAAALASLVGVFTYIELGSPYTWLVWLATSLISFICYPAGTVWLPYILIFGVYPILKGYIERAPRPLWIVLKLVFANISLLLLLLGTELLLGVPFFGEGELFGISYELLRIPVWIILVLCILLFDYFLSIMARFYTTRLRDKFKRLLR